MLPLQHAVVPTAPLARGRQWPRRGALALASALLLAACGGGGGSGSSGTGNAEDGASPPPVAGCSVAEQKTWLGDYMREWYFWYRLAPNPDAAASGSLAEYFQSLLYRGGNAEFPTDRWSRSESTESFNRFFGEGRSMGYGLAVAGLEVVGQPEQPLRVRSVEPQSDAAAKGIRRGDQVLSLNARPAAELIRDNDFTLLSAEREGQALALVLRDAAGAERSVMLTASIFALTPVPGATVLATPQGRRIGYVQANQMITQAQAPLAAAFRQFQEQGVADVVLDLRYNGGGLVSVAGTMASHVVGARVAGSTFTRLLYNDRRAATNNQTFAFTQPQPALGLSRVFVLAGRRSCSASELLVNGLLPFAQVVVIGETSCGKPVGFLPSSQCGSTYSVVNFEGVNARGEGRYWDGLPATCAVPEDFTRPLGAPGEPLLDAARSYADSGVCPPLATAQAMPLMAPRARPTRSEPGDRQQMLAR